MLPPSIYDGTARGLLSIESVIEEADLLAEAKQAAALGTFNLQSYVKGAYAIYVKVPTEVDAKGWKYYAMPTTPQGKAAIGKMVAKDPKFLDTLSDKALASIKAQVGDFAAWMGEISAIVDAEKAKPAVEPAPLEFLAPDQLAKMLTAQFDKAGTTLAKAAADPALASELAKIYGADWAAKFTAGKDGTPYSKTAVAVPTMPVAPTPEPLKSVEPELPPEPVLASPEPPPPPPPDPAVVQAQKVSALKLKMYKALGFHAFTADPETGLALLKDQYKAAVAKLAAEDPDWEETYPQVATSSGWTLSALDTGPSTPASLVADVQALGGGMGGDGINFAGEVELRKKHGKAWNAAYTKLDDAAYNFSQLAGKFFSNPMPSVGHKQMKWAEFIDAEGGPDAVEANPLLKHKVIELAQSISLGWDPDAWKQSYDAGKAFVEPPEPVGVAAGGVVVSAAPPEPVAPAEPEDDLFASEVHAKLADLAGGVDLKSTNVQTSKAVFDALKDKYPLLAADLKAEFGDAWESVFPHNDDVTGSVNGMVVNMATAAFDAKVAEKEQAVIDSFQKLMVALYPKVPFGFGGLDPHVVVQNLKDGEPDLVSSMTKLNGPNWDKWFIAAYQKKQSSVPMMTAEVPAPPAVVVPPDPTPAPGVDAPAVKGAKVAAWLATQFPGSDFEAEAATMTADEFAAGVDALTVVAPLLMAGIEAEFGADWKASLHALHKSKQAAAPTVVAAPPPLPPENVVASAPKAPAPPGESAEEIELEKQFDAAFAHPKMAELYNSLLASTAADPELAKDPWHNHAGFAWGLEGMISSDEDAYPHAQAVFGLDWAAKLRAAIMHKKKKLGAAPLPVVGGGVAAPAVSAAAPASTGASSSEELVAQFDTFMQWTPKIAKIYNTVLLTSDSKSDVEATEAAFADKVADALHAEPSLQTLLKSLFGPGDAGYKKLWSAIRAKRKKQGATLLPVSGSAADVPAPAPVPGAAAPVAAFDAALGALPSAADLTYAGEASGIGGAGQKAFYTGPDGKKYLFKLATTKSTNKPKPYAAVAQELTSYVALAIKPNHIPVKTITLGGQVGTIQPWLGDSLQTLKSMTPGALTSKEMLDVASEHVLDWVTSNHDSHSANLMQVPGGIVGIDKEQAFRFFKDDKLSTDYAPNVGENPPFYNQFWKDWADDKAVITKFDPQQMLPAIEKVEQVDDAAYEALLKKYFDALPPAEQAAQPGFVKAALARKQNVRKDFETFLTDLHRKKKKKPFGVFTFAGGWQENPTAAAPLPTASAGVPTAGTGAAATPTAAEVAASGPYGEYAAPAPVSLPGATYAKPWAAWSFPFTTGSTLSAMKDPAADVSVYGGTKEKHILKGPGDSQFLLKPAKTDPERAEAAAAAAKIASLLNPAGSYVPVKSMEFLDDTGTMVKGSVQPVLPSVGTLKDKDIKNLTAKQLQQLQRERVLDWLIGNHDTKGANFVVTPSGDIIGIDKERAFKPFMVATTTGSKQSDDQLSLSYSAQGITPPIYNALYSAYAKKQIDLNPMDVLPTIEQIEKIPEKTYKQMVAPYIDTLAASEGWGAAKKKAVLTAILARKANIRADFEKFFTSLRAARGEPGAFKFPAPGSVAAVKPAPFGGTPVATSVGTPVSVAAASAALAAAQAQAKEKFAAAQAQYLKDLAQYNADVAALNAAAVAATPEGQPKPPSGKKWVQVPGKSAVGMALSPGGGMKESPYLVNGAPDPSSVNTTLKFNSKTPAEAEAFLKANGVDVVKVSKGSSYAAVAVVSKAQLAKAKTTTDLSWELTDISLPDAPTPPPSMPAMPQTFTPYEIPPYAPVPTIDAIGNLESDKEIKSGKSFLSDGAAVEGQQVVAKRYIDEDGVPYYQMVFKVRPEGAALMQGGSAASDGWNNAVYDPAADAYRVTLKTNAAGSGAFSGQTHKFNDRMDGRQWTSGKSSLFHSEGSSQYAYKNYTIARVYPEAGESVDAAFARVLKTAGEPFATAVLTPPTPEDQRKMRLAKLYWSLDPQGSDALPESKRTLPELTKRLTALGVTPEQMDSIQDVEVAPGLTASVLPGRGKAIAKKNKVRCLFTGISSAKNVPLALAGQLGGIVQRNLNGVEAKGASYDSDVASGAADQVLCRVVNDNYSSYDFYSATVTGDINFVIHPDEMDRLDAYFFNGDKFGCCNPSGSHGSAWKSRPSLEAGTEGSMSSSNEIMFRRAIRPESIVKIACRSDSSRQEVLNACKAAGITEVRGIPIEEFVVVSSSGSSIKKFYENHLKATGY